MQWFEYAIAVCALLLVIVPLIVFIAKKKKGTLKCECGESVCSGKCGSCKDKDVISLIYIISVMGMKCGMCESHINDNIRKNFDVVKVKSSRKKNETIIESKQLLNIASIKEAITGMGYTVTSIRLG